MSGSKLIEDLGEALYGLDWHGPLASALGLPEQTIRHWAAGIAEPDRQHYGALIALGASKVTVMTRLMERLEVQIRSVTP
ncbi:MAG: hypothetical protein RIB41_10165 [Oceanibaculum nanhaiense]|jgi:hypothetical protein|uniref:hypothetical protein n=1 Tax=Oceanibaculum nanhaiense TaxID=1909734 RepID=UPI0032ECF64F